MEKLRSSMKDNNYAHAIWEDASSDLGWEGNPWPMLEFHSYYADIKQDKIVSSDLGYRILEQLTQTIIGEGEYANKVATYTHEDMFSPLVMLAAIDSRVKFFCNTTWTSLDDDAEPLKRHREWAEVVFAEAHRNAEASLAKSTVEPDSPLRTAFTSYNEIMNEIKQQDDRATCRQHMRKIIYVNMVANREISEMFTKYAHNEIWKRDGHLSDELLDCDALVKHLNRHIVRLRAAALHEMKVEIRKGIEGPLTEPDLTRDVLEFFVDSKNVEWPNEYGIKLTESEQNHVSAIIEQTTLGKRGLERSHHDIARNRDSDAQRHKVAAAANEAAMKRLRAAMESDDARHSESDSSSVEDITPAPASFVPAPLAPTKKRRTRSTDAVQEEPKRQK